MKVSTTALLYLFLLSTAEGAHDARMKKHAQSLAQSMETDKKAKGGPGTDRRIFVLDEELLSCTVDDNCDEYGTEDTLKCEGTEGKEGLWCHCLDSHIFNKVTKRCQAVTLRDIDTPCPEDEECGEGHICEDNECRCLKGTFFNKDNKQCQASNCPRNTFWECNEDQDICEDYGANCVQYGDTDTKYCKCAADGCYAREIQTDFAACRKDLPINWCSLIDAETEYEYYWHVGNWDTTYDYTQSEYYKEGEPEYWQKHDLLLVKKVDETQTHQAEVLKWYDPVYHPDRWEQLKVKYTSGTLKNGTEEWIDKCRDVVSVRVGNTESSSHSDQQ